MKPKQGHVRFAPATKIPPMSAAPRLWALLQVATEHGGHITVSRLGGRAVHITSGADLVRPHAAALGWREITGGVFEYWGPISGMES